VEQVARMAEKKSAYKIFVGIPEWKRPFGRPRGRQGGRVWTVCLRLRIGTSDETR
jgi:hypothetical protein